MILFIIIFDAINRVNEVIVKFLKKYIPVAFLWLAWVCVTGHLMIPHDHHLLDSFAGPDTECPAGNHELQHHPVIPIHCHAFNELASEKAIIFNLTALFADFITYKQDFNINKTAVLNSSDYSDRDFSIPDNFLLYSSSLRAPPGLS